MRVTGGWKVGYPDMARHEAQDTSKTMKKIRTLVMEMAPARVEPLPELFTVLMADSHRAVNSIHAG